MNVEIGTTLWHQVHGSGFEESTKINKNDVEKEYKWHAEKKFCGQRHVWNLLTTIDTSSCAVVAKLQKNVVIVISKRVGLLGK